MAILHGWPRALGNGYLRRWVPLSVAIGLLSGAMALAFYHAVNLTLAAMLGGIAGYVPPAPAGEGGGRTAETGNPLMIPLVTTLGGLISGLLVYGLAPEAEGHGTDSAIDAFHNRGGLIRFRVPVVKLVASAITIGSGGSAGREGPTALIAAGMGSALTRFLRLSERERRIALAVGLGAGIGAIFKAPFGGALLASEILYRRDFEVDVLIPAFIASTVAYSLFGSFSGWQPVFGPSGQYVFHDPTSLPLYAVLGLLCGLVGIAYVRAFWGATEAFRRLNVPNFLKPAIGGLLVGVIGAFLPQVLEMGYGWLQMLMSGDREPMPLPMLLALIPAKIVATSLTVGSGGSGGVFAPALFIGGFVGAAAHAVFRSVFPWFVESPAAMVIVGMMSFFGGVGKVPIAVILMVSEMTGMYTLLVPSMVATSISYVITGDHTLYRSQVPSRAESPAHRAEYRIPVLKTIRVRDVMTTNVVTVGPDASLSDAMRLMTGRGVKGLPVVESEGRVVGIITLEDLLKVDSEEWSSRTVKSVMSRKLILATPDEDLLSVFQKMTGNEVGRLPVVDPSSGRLIGIITRGDVARAYEIAMGSGVPESPR